MKLRIDTFTTILLMTVICLASYTGCNVHTKKAEEPDPREWIDPRPPPKGETFETGQWMSPAPDASDKRTRWIRTAPH